MKLKSALFVAWVLLAPCLHAQEGIMQQSMKNKVANEGLGKTLQLLETQVASATDRLMLIKKCHEQGMFIGSDGAGKEECIEVIQTCKVPWSGAVMAPGDAIVAYASATVPFGQSCPSETRVCNPATATLSGSFTQQSCVVTSGTECVLPWGGTLSSTLTPTSPATSATSVVAYAAATVPYGSTCTSETRVCRNGNLSGSYTKAACAVTPPANCTLPWGGSLASGAGVSAYQNASVPYGSSCVAETRTCTNGTLSGSFTNSSCTVAQPANCTLPWGGTLASGNSVTAYQASSVPYGSTCASQTRTCTNGTLGGSFTNAGCSVQPPALRWTYIRGVCVTYEQAQRMPPCPNAAYGSPAGQSCPVANATCFTAASDSGCSNIGNMPLSQYACQ